jgi:hypothetical protein
MADVMVIRGSQMEAFRDAAARSFEEEMLGRLRDFNPRHFDVVGVEGMRQVIRRGIRKAEGFEFTSRGPVRLFLNMMVMFGSDFFNDPIYPWAGEILSQKAVPQMERAMQLHAAVNAYSDAVGGMHFKFERKAIEKAQSIGWEDLKPPPGRLCCRQSFTA